MQVACDHCGAEYELDKDAITGRGVRITCPTCSHVFVVYKNDGEVEAAGYEIDLDELDLNMEDILKAVDSKDASEGQEELIDIDLDIDLEIDLDIEVEEPEDTVALESNEIVSTEVNPTLEAPETVQNNVPEVDGEDVHVTDEEVAALDVNTLNFASVGIKSWRVKRTFGLMFEYSDFKTFTKSLSDGRITGDDSISPDGENWEVLKDIGDYESYFCRTYLEFERRGVAPITRKVKEKVVQPLGGMNELASALAAAQAEVEEAQSSNKKPSSRRTKTTTKPARPTPTPSVQGQSSGSPVVSFIGLVLLLVGGWFVFGRSKTPPEVPVVQQQTPKKVESTQAEKDALLEEVRAELRKSTAKIEEEREADEPEPASEEPQLMVKVPEEVLAQQRALQDGKAIQPVAPKQTTNHLEDAQKALRSNDWNAAVASFQAAVKANERNNPEVQAGLGFALYKSGKESEGQRTLKLASQQGSVTANKWLGYILKEQGDVGGANQYFTKYLESSPSDAAQIRMEMNQ